MSKIKFQHNGTNYVLEYTRDSVAEMEHRLKLNLMRIEDAVVSNMWAIFKGAFLANHPTISDETINEIYSEMTDKQKLVQELSVMLTDTVNTLFVEPKKSEKNIVWERGR